MIEDYEAELRQRLAEIAAAAPTQPELAERIEAATIGARVRPRRADLPGARWRWAVPLVAAAAVVAVVLLAASATLLGRAFDSADRVSPPTVSSAPPTTHPVPAGRSSTTTETTESTTGSSSYPSGQTVTQVGPVGGPVPVGFVPTSVTFVDSQLGWALGTAPCRQAPCTSVVRTRDGGATWQGIPAPLAGLDPAAPATSPVSSIRFADALNGWTFGTEIWATHNGGATWARVALPATTRAVSGLETDNGIVYAVTDPCVTPGSSRCDSTTSVFQSAVASDAWTRIAVLATSGGTGSGGSSVALDASLVVHGSDWWVLLPAGLYHGQGPIHSGKGPAAPVRLVHPCAGVFTAAGAVAASIAVADAEHLDALCIGASGAQGTTADATQLRGTTDGGRTWKSVGPRSALGPTGLDVQSLADNGSGQLLVASANSDGALIRRTSDDGTSYRVTLQPGSSGPRWTELGFTTATQGVAVLGGTALFMTYDAGLTWRPVTF